MSRAMLDRSWPIVPRATQNKTANTYVIEITL